MKNKLLIGIICFVCMLVVLPLTFSACSKKKQDAITIPNKAYEEEEGSTTNPNKEGGSGGSNNQPNQGGNQGDEGEENNPENPQNPEVYDDDDEATEEKYLVKEIYGANLDIVAYEITRSNTELSGDLVLPKSYKQKPIVRLGRGVFSDIETITSVSGANVEEIGARAFRECLALKTVSFPKVEMIDFEGFYKCTSLETVSFPSIRELKDSVFRDCSSLLSFDFSTLKIFDDAFTGCTSLTSVSIPDGVSGHYYDNGDGTGYYDAIGFSGCSNLKSISIGKVNASYIYLYGCPIETASVNYENVGTEFSDMTTLKSLTLGENVKTFTKEFAYLGNPNKSSFSGCDALETIVVSADNPLYMSAGNCIINKQTKAVVFGFGSSIIPTDGSVTSIESLAFLKISTLEEIAIPDAITEIGNNAFTDCQNFKTLLVGSGMTAEGFGDVDDPCPFVRCPIENLTLNYETIGSVFRSGYSDADISESLKRVVLGPNVKNIENAFYGCKLLEEVTLPSGLQTIGDCAFEMCKALTSIEIPDSVTTIGRSAFQEAGIEELVIGDNVTTIGADAFMYCRSLTTLSIGSGVQTFGVQSWQEDARSIFLGCPIETLYVNYENVGAAKEFGAVRTIETITFGDNVKTIGSLYSLSSSSYSGENQPKLKTVTIGSGVTTIDGNAFRYCTQIETVSVNYETVGASGEFDGKSNLTSLTFGPNVKTIARFSNCDGLTEISIPSTVTALGSSAFAHCDGLTEFVIPNTVTSVGDYVLYDCSNLTTLSIGSGVTSFGNNAFKSCPSITTLVVNCKNIPNSFFRSRTSLETLVLGDNVETIESLAFDGCTGLTRIVIPNGVTTIGASAFRGCTNVTTVTIGSSVTSIGNDAFWKGNGYSAYSKVFYAGTSASEWASISIGSSNSHLTSAPRYYYSEEQPVGSGNFWHYVDGVVTIW